MAISYDRYAKIIHINSPAPKYHVIKRLYDYMPNPRSNDIQKDVYVPMKTMIISHFFIERMEMFSDKSQEVKKLQK